jgi:hypothetical protein
VAFHKAIPHEYPADEQFMRAIIAMQYGQRNWLTDAATPSWANHIRFSPPLRDSVAAILCWMCDSRMYEEVFMKYTRNLSPAVIQSSLSREGLVNLMEFAMTKYMPQQVRVIGGLMDMTTVSAWGVGEFAMIWSQFELLLELGLVLTPLYVYAIIRSLLAGRLIDTEDDRILLAYLDSHGLLSNNPLLVAADIRTRMLHLIRQPVSFEKLLNPVVESDQAQIWLQESLRVGCFWAAQYLMEQGVEVKGDAGETLTPHALMMKLFDNRRNVNEVREFLRFLVSKGANINHTTLRVKSDELVRESLLSLAVQASSYDIVTILDLGASVHTPESIRAFHGVLAMDESMFANAFMSHGFDLTSKSSDGWPVMHHVLREHSPDFRPIARLIKMGADVNAPAGPQNQTPLMIAIQSGWAYEHRLASIHRLVHAGADPKMEDTDGRNSFDYARKMLKHEKIGKYLFKILNGKISMPVKEKGESSSSKVSMWFFGINA